MAKKQSETTSKNDNDVPPHTSCIAINHPDGKTEYRWEGPTESALAKKSKK